MLSIKSSGRKLIAMIVVCTVIVGTAVVLPSFQKALADPLPGVAMLADCEPGLTAVSAWDGWGGTAEFDSTKSIEGRSSIKYTSNEVGNICMTITGSKAVALDQYKYLEFDVWVDGGNNHMSFANGASVHVAYVGEWVQNAELVNKVFVSGKWNHVKLDMSEKTRPASGNEILFYFPREAAWQGQFTFNIDNIKVTNSEDLLLLDVEKEGDIVPVDASFGTVSVDTTKASIGNTSIKYITSTENGNNQKGVNLYTANSNVDLEDYDYLEMDIWVDENSKNLFLDHQGRVYIAFANKPAWTPVSSFDREMVPNTWNRFKLDLRALNITGAATVFSLWMHTANGGEKVYTLNFDNIRLTKADSDTSITSFTTKASGNSDLLLLDVEEEGDIVPVDASFGTVSVDHSKASIGNASIKYITSIENNNNQKGVNLYTANSNANLDDYDYLEMDIWVDEDSKNIFLDHQGRVYIAFANKPAWTPVSSFDREMVPNTWNRFKLDLRALDITGTATVFSLWMHTANGGEKVYTLNFDNIRLTKVGSDTPVEEEVDYPVEYTKGHVIKVPAEVMSINLNVAGVSGSSVVGGGMIDLIGNETYTTVTVIAPNGKSYMDYPVTIQKTDYKILYAADESYLYTPWNETFPKPTDGFGGVSVFDGTNFTQGTKSIKYTAGSGGSVGLELSFEPTDISNYRYFAFDIFVDGANKGLFSEHEEFNIRFNDSADDNYAYSNKDNLEMRRIKDTPLNAGWNTIVVEFSKVAPITADLHYFMLHLPTPLTAKKDYVFNIDNLRVFGSNVAEPTDDADLINLSVTNGAGNTTYTLTPAFDKDTLNYAVTIPFYENSVNIVVEKSSAKATVTGDGVSNIPSSGKTINVVVTSEDTTETKTYVVTVTQAARPKSIEFIDCDEDTSTAEEWGWGGSVVYDYTKTSDRGTGSFKYTTAATGDQTGWIGLTVKGSQALPVNQYKYLEFDVWVDENNTDVFANGAQVYVAYDGNWLVTHELQNKIFTANQWNTVRLDMSGKGRPSSQNYVQIYIPNSPIDSQPNNVREYTFNVDNFRLSNIDNDTKVTSVKVTNSGTDYTPYETVDNTYKISVPDTLTSVDLSMVLSNIEAIASGLGTIVLSSATTTVPVTVTASDGTTTENYSVVIQKVATNNCDLASISGVGESGDIYSVTPAFSAGTLSYTMTIAYTEEKVTLSAVKVAPLAAVTGGGALTLTPVSNQTTTFTVTAEDGVTTKTYTVNVVRPDKPESLIIYDAEASFSRGGATYPRDMFGGTCSFQTVHSEGSKSVKYSTATIGDNKGWVGLELGFSPKDISGHRYLAFDIYVDEANKNVFANHGDFELRLNDKEYRVSAGIHELEPLMKPLNVGWNTLVVDTSKLANVPEILEYIMIYQHTPTAGKFDYTFNIDNVRIYNQPVEPQNANLKSLTVVGSDGYIYTQSLRSNFNVDIDEYNLTIPAGCQSITLSGETEQDIATVTGLGVHTLADGKQVINVVVTAPDGTTKQTYKINVNHANPNTIPVFSCDSYEGKFTAQNNIDVSLDTGDKKEGEASLKLEGPIVYGHFHFDPVNITDMRYLRFSFYVEDTDPFFNAECAVNISSSGNQDNNIISAGVRETFMQLKAGWNDVVLDLRVFTGKGDIDLTKVNFIRIYALNDTNKTSYDFKFDNLRFCTSLNELEFESNTSAPAIVDPDNPDDPDNPGGGTGEVFSEPPDQFESDMPGVDEDSSDEYDTTPGGAGNGQNDDEDYDGYDDDYYDGEDDDNTQAGVTGYVAIFTIVVISSAAILFISYKKKARKF